jgi:hypothetical protein
MNDYYSKYLKYKNKYIKLKELRGGSLLLSIKEKEIVVNTKCEYNNSTMIRGVNCPMIYCEINKTFPFNFCLSNEI